MDDDPFAGLGDIKDSSKSKQDRGSEKESRRRAKKRLYDSVDDLDLEKKPANPYILFVALAVFLASVFFGLKPASFSMSDVGVYAVQVDIELIGEKLIRGQCRPTGENEALANTSVALASIPGKSGLSLERPLPFAEAVKIEGGCFFEVIFDGVLPTDGNTFDITIDLPNKKYKVQHKLDPQMKIGPIRFTVR